MFHEILKIRVKHLFNLQFKTRLIFRKCMLLIGKKGPRASLILQVFYYEDTGLPAKLEPPPLQILFALVLSFLTLSP